VPPLPTVHDRGSSMDGRADLVTIVRYLVEAVADDEVTLAEAELAIEDWTHDPTCCARRSPCAIQMKAPQRPRR
jgi:hypothetical protein